METRLRPILFSGPMVRAILDGRKTQTRRVVKPQPVNAIFHNGQWIEAECDVVESDVVLKCPYGKPGDRLWVRETWGCVRGEAGDLSSSDDTVYYRCDRNHKVVHHNRYSQEADGNPIKWRPSIHMPRYFSRITLEVTNIRVERLQDITEEDAECEGVEPNSPPEATGATCRGAFKHLWDSINAKKYPWDSSPWVWVIEFKMIED